MREHVAGGDLIESRIILEPAVGCVCRQRCIEIENIPFGQLHHRVREHRLADRRGVEQRVRRYRGIGGSVRHPETSAPCRATVREERDGHTGYASRLHQRGHLLLKVGNQRCGQRTFVGTCRRLRGRRTCCVREHTQPESGATAFDQKASSRRLLRHTCPPEDEFR
jgi:hypothetical protein